MAGVIGEWRERLDGAGNNPKAHRGGCGKLAGFLALRTALQRSGARSLAGKDPDPETKCDTVLTRS
jgi:hypothetical protein